MPSRYVTDDEYKYALGETVHNMRSKGHFLDGHPDRVAWVQRMGWVNNERDAMWEDLQGHLRRFHAVKGHLRVPWAYVTDDEYKYPLGQRVKNMRSQGLYLKGHPDRIAWVKARGFVMDTKNAQKNAEKWAALECAPAPASS